jgi:hypothetical protein
VGNGGPWQLRGLLRRSLIERGEGSTDGAVRRNYSPSAGLDCGLLNKLADLV